MEPLEERVAALEAKVQALTQVVVDHVKRQDQQAARSARLALMPQRRMWPSRGGALSDPPEAA